MRFAAILAVAVTSLLFVASAGAMRGQFNSPGTLKSHGTIVKVSGPYQLASDETSTVIDATVTQGSCVAYGSSGSLTGAGTWRAALETNGCSLHAGSATATATGHTQEKSGGTEDYIWTQSITLSG